MRSYDTIQFKRPYRDINDTMYWLIEQAKTGVDYCRQVFPRFSDPYELFYYLKPMITYKNDPGHELIQSPGTLFEDNCHGISGAGDCDCFTCLLLSIAWAQGWYGDKMCKIVLAGRSKRYPKHIYCIQQWGDHEIIMDLTEPVPNQERIYPLKQVLQTI